MRVFSPLLTMFSCALLCAPIAAQTSADEQAPEYLITVTAGAGASLEAGEQSGCYALVLNDADHVIWFSDRPARQAHSAHAANLAEGWNESFADSAPNADLQLFQEDGTSVSLILTLNDPPTWEADKQTLSFDNACEIEVAGKDTGNDAVNAEIQLGEFPMAALFIDGAKLFAWNSCVSKYNDRICMEQWGSYPASCFKAGDRPAAIAKYKGKQCKNVCKGTACYTKYDQGESWKNLASSYWCSEDPGITKCAP